MPVGAEVGGGLAAPVPRAAVPDTAPALPWPSADQDTAILDAATRATARYLESIRHRPPLLTAFLREMPKGGDLHNHLSGTVYAESYLAWAMEDGVCVDPAALSLAFPPCDAAAGRPPAAEALRDVALYGRLVDALSMRNWDPSQQTGHSRFFGSFVRFDPGQPGRRGDMLAEAQARAALGRVSYLELMLTPDTREARTLGERLGWSGDVESSRRALLAAGMDSVAERTRQILSSMEARRDSVLGCGGPSPHPGCGVEVRYLYSVSRARTPASVFGQILMGFELASRDPRVVGLNLVQPEDHPTAMADYSLHMRMIGELRRHYPGVGITLHAGELAWGLVPPEGLRFHVREAVEVAGARRIGHGVSIMHEERPFELLDRMAREGVLVEIALTSNDVILGVRGAEHPLSVYLEWGVPVALATDDEGVARSEMTREFQRAVEEQGLDYPTLKTMVRNSLEFAFVEGESLWADRRRFRPVTPCAGPGGVLSRTVACRAFAQGSPKAALQLALEADLAAFEARHR